MECSPQQVQIHQIVVFIIMMIILSTEFNVDYMDQPTDMYSFFQWHNVILALTTSNWILLLQDSNESKDEDFVHRRYLIKWMNIGASDDLYTAPVWITVDRFSNWINYFRTCLLLPYLAYANLSIFYLIQKVDGLTCLTKSASHRRTDRWASQFVYTEIESLLSWWYSSSASVKHWRQTNTKSTEHVHAMRWWTFFYSWNKSLTQEKLYILRLLWPDGWPPCQVSDFFESWCTNLSMHFGPED